MKPDISIVFPVFNEEKRVIKSLIRVSKYFQDLKTPYEILVVDDGSNDRTIELITALALHDPTIRFFFLKQNLGKGAAIRYGIQKSRGKYIFFSDIDLSVPISSLPKFISKLQKGCEVVIASRRSRGSQIIVRQNLIRQTLGHFFTKLSTGILGLGVSDVTCGFKGFQASAAKKLFKHSTINRWAFDAEILFLAKRLGFTISEVPVEWTNKAGTKVSLVRDIPRTLVDLLKIRFS